MIKNNNNKRCCICDYCHVSSPYEPSRSFSKAHGSDDYVCHICVGSVEEALEEFVGEEESPTDPFEMPLEAPTLAVHGDPGGVKVIARVED